MSQLTPEVCKATVDLKSDLKPLHPIAALTIVDAIKNLRQQHGFKVLVLSKNSPLNLPEDSKAISYYLSHPEDALKSEKDKPLAQYDSPFSYRDVKNIGSRAYADRKVILLDPSFDKNILLHEYGHSLINSCNYLPAGKVNNFPINSATKDLIEINALAVEILAEVKKINGRPISPLLKKWADI